MTAITSVNKHRLRVLRIISLCLCLFILTGSTAFAAEVKKSSATQTTAAAGSKKSKTTASDDTLSNLQGQYDALEKQKAENKKKLAAVKGEIKTQKGVVSEINSRIAATQSQINLYSAQVNILNNDITLTEQQIEVINGQIGSLGDKISATEEAMTDKQNELDETYELLKQRLRAAYIAGNGSTLEFLLSSKDFSTLLTRAELVKRVAEHDNDLMNVLESEIETLNDLKNDYNDSVKEQETRRNDLNEKSAALNDQKADLNDANDILKAKQTEIQGEYAKANAELNTLDKESDEYKALIAQQEEEMIRLSAQMEEYIRAHGSSTKDIEKEPETKAPEPVTNEVGEPVTNEDGSQVVQEPETVAPPSNVTPSNPGFIFPLKCGGVYISSPYGYRTHPTTGQYKLHTGTDFAAANIYQQPIYAAQAGEVIFAGPQGGYGNFIIVDHGNGLSTCYAHCDSISCWIGQKVTQGQVIGRVGTTGNSTGPHLHFEVRIDGSTVDPMGGYVHLP